MVVSWSFLGFTINDITWSKTLLFAFFSYFVNYSYIKLTKQAFYVSKDKRIIARKVEVLSQKSKKISLHENSTLMKNI